MDGYGDPTFDDDLPAELPQSKYEPDARKRERVDQMHRALNARLHEIDTLRDALPDSGPALAEIADILEVDAELIRVEKRALVAAARLRELQHRVAAQDLVGEMAHRRRLAEVRRRTELLKAEWDEKYALKSRERIGGWAMNGKNAPPKAEDRSLNMPVERFLVGDLAEARDILATEFPHAVAVIDGLLAPLAARSTVWIRPTLFVGAPGCGKSRFARRLAEVLGLETWRVDAAREASNSFAGLERRWHGSEPCHPLAAILRAKCLNPAILLDELEKAGTGTENGQLWSALLGFLEKENAKRYPDPHYQQNVNLSEITYLATANSLTRLPGPLLDRFRVIPFPEPEIEHLPAFLPQLIAEIASDAGVPVDWYPPIDGDELAAIRRVWSDRSLRSLLRIVEAVLTARELAAQRH